MVSGVIPLSSDYGIGKPASRKARKPWRATDNFRRGFRYGTAGAQGSRINLAGDDPEHVIVVPSGLFAPTAKAGFTAAISGDEVEGDFA